ncbi:3-deoxy-D-manno-octulosonic acid kinase [Alteromonas oceanisediminis]|uniref:3-deoxy-D-manno-octulosonic acid kinase n=1 Tax=Alteromonas oceanisediminis TaxID=2836180 RepID=UPI001BDB558F|nr:3-deoxy-D-manno-octulosonic acid kinase [Alteromonas oceanisediminis]MBT0586754.1 3-deoxy-D-manno-octulosonic acid kinase [Alteromonas oceanisediminis]
MHPLSYIQFEQTHVWFYPEALRQHQLSEPTPRWFEPHHLPHEFTITGSATGRGTTWFLAVNNTQLVLRHYQRGGLISRLSRDTFMLFSMPMTRPVRELRLLAQLQDWHLPAPQPIAGRVIRNGLVWRGDLLTVKIPGASDVHSLLLSRSLSIMEWRHIGATIRRFHNRQVFHHDLNIHNIMLDDEGQAWLIDFDKCGVRNGQRWKKANLARLKRSLDKESVCNPNYHFTSDNWQAILDGYGR